MALKLPKDDETKKEAKTTAKKATKRIRTAPTTRGVNAQREALSPEDVIEYGVTVEVSPGKGQKAWVRFATTSSVRDGETTEQARSRVTDYVNEEIDRRIDDLG